MSGGSEAMPVPAPIHPAIVTPGDFRAAMRLIVGNVSVITAGTNDDRSGLVVISVVSLSAEPPKVIACVNRSSSTWSVIERHGHFAVNSLGPQHQKVAERFSGFGGIKGNARYEGADWTTLKTGASVLSDAVAVFDCSLDEMIDRGTHSIIIGSVEAVKTQDAGQALLYWRGSYRPLEVA